MCDHVAKTIAEAEPRALLKFVCIFNFLEKTHRDVEGIGACRTV